LRKLGYVITRQSSSYLRVTTQAGGQHQEFIPNYSPIKIGTLKSILRNVAADHPMSVPEVLELLNL
jgi:hypothetical protein